LAIGFGVPIIVFMAVDYAGPIIIAGIVGYLARWSFLASGVLGYPLVVLATAVAPIGNTEHSALPVPVPWLAVYKKASSQEAFTSAIQDQLPINSAVFLTALLVGIVHAEYDRRKAK
jgi:hypothetical protein